MLFNKMGINNERVKQLLALSNTQTYPHTVHIIACFVALCPWMGIYINVLWILARLLCIFNITQEKAWVCDCEKKWYCVVHCISWLKLFQYLSLQGGGQRKKFHKWHKYFFVPMFSVEIHFDHRTFQAAKCKINSIYMSTYNGKLVNMPTKLQKYLRNTVMENQFTSSFALPPFISFPLLE